MKSFTTVLSFTLLLACANDVLAKPRPNRLGDPYAPIRRTTAPRPVAIEKLQDLGASFISTALMEASEVGSAQPTALGVKIDSASIVAQSSTALAVKETAMSTARKASASAVAKAKAAAAAAAPSAPAAIVKPDLDLTVLNFALTLERLESEFYKQALAKFSAEAMVAEGYTQEQADIIIEQATLIGADETGHVAALQGAIKALGGTPNLQCGFTFGAALTSAATFLATARVLENVGVSAYAGGAPIITSNQVLLAAAQILPIEARHQTLVNILNGQTSAAQAFDIPLAPAAVLALAGGFLTNCTAADLGLTANQPLSVVDEATGTATFQVGSKLGFTSTSPIDASDPNLFCHMLQGGHPISTVFPASACKIPEGSLGPTYVLLTNSSTPLASDVTIQDQRFVKAGPALLFVDDNYSKIGQRFIAAGNKTKRGYSQIDLGLFTTGYLRFLVVLWLCVVQQSGEGLSIVFLMIWLAGDFTNLLGAFWQGLLPTMIILAVYYTLCDIVLISQVFYYRRKRRLYPALFTSAPSETDPLLSSFSAADALDPSHPLTSKTKRYRDLIGYLGGLVIVVAVSLIAWRLSRSTDRGRQLEVWDTKAQIVGWISAFLYLGSRIPQIFKNIETKCQGLSLLMFAFSVAGNATYVASILLRSLSLQHLAINASWLLGSGGTIFLDFIVLGQFWWYASARREAAKVFSDDEAIAAGDDEAAL